MKVNSYAGKAEVFIGGKRIASRDASIDLNVATSKPRQSGPRTVTVTCELQGDMRPLQRLARELARQHFDETAARLLEQVEQVVAGGHVAVVIARADLMDVPFLGTAAAGRLVSLVELGHAEISAGAHGGMRQHEVVVGRGAQIGRAA